MGGSQHHPKRQNDSPKSRHIESDTKGGNAYELGQDNVSQAVLLLDRQASVQVQMSRILLPKQRLLGHNSSRLSIPCTMTITNPPVGLGIPMKLVGRG